MKPWHIPFDSDAFHMKYGAPGKVEDVDVSKRMVKGYFSAFNNIDAHKDRILPGAFKKTVVENGPLGTGRVKFLRDHNPAMPVGPLKELAEDSFGLMFVAQLNDTAAGKDLAVLYDTGEITEHSIGFELLKGGYLENEDGGLDIKEVRLWEGSAVLWAANQLAKLVELKSRFERLKSIGELSDPLLHRVEDLLFLLENEAARRKAMPAPNPEPEKDPHQESESEFAKSLLQELKNHFK
jgi:HK97 family phage prohead protease